MKSGEPVARPAERQQPDPEAHEHAVAALQRVIAHLRRTRAPAALLRETGEALVAMALQLAPHDHPGPFAQGGLEVGEGGLPPEVVDPAAFFPYSPVVGARNPISPRIRFDVRDGELHALHRFDAPWCGPPAAVHGGVIALVFDELLGSVTVVNGVGGFTGTLEVKYRALVPLEEPIRCRGWIDRRDGRKTWARGTMHHGDVLCAEATGLFIAPGAESVERIRRAHAGVPA